MQNATKTHVKKRLSLKGYLKVALFPSRYPAHPEELEPFLSWLKEETGASDEIMSTMRNLYVSSRRVKSDNTATYRVDRYMLAGMGAVDLVLIPVLIPMGVPDRSLSVALLSLCCSLVLVATSLFVGFVKSDAGITSYGTFHSTLILLSLVSGGTAIIATVWHISVVIGALFLILTNVGLITCAVYYVVVLWGREYLKLLLTCYAR